MCRCAAYRAVCAVAVDNVNKNQFIATRRGFDTNAFTLTLVLNDT